MKERKRAHHLFDCRDLGGVALQKFQTRGHVCEQVPHLDHDAGQYGPDSLFHELARADAQPGAGARGLHVSDRGDAREGLATEAERLDRDEVGKLGQLARGVTQKGHRQLVGRDSGAVVADADRGLPRTPRVDADPPCTRVEGVLDELLDDRRRAFDHLARGDRVRDFGRQHLDHGVSFARSW